MKKIFISSMSVIVLFTIFAVIILNKGTTSTSLYLLNWGEYIDESLLAKFEKENDCTIVLECVTSSETMYQKISAGTTSYDVAIPGDYMVTKLYNEDYLYELDINNSSYTNLSNYKNLFVDKLNTIRNNQNSLTLTYSMPYFWGAYSIIYSNIYDETESVVKNNGFKSLYDKTLYSHDVKVGMYNTARWALTSYLLSENIDPNTNDFIDTDIVNAIKNASFDVWGDDALKRKTATGDIDLCYTQLGDFFDALYLALSEGMAGNVGLDNLSFNVYVPQNTVAFYDAMVIPKTSKNYDLANKFIDFMLDSENAFQNALAVGYSPTLKSVVQKFNDNPDMEYYSDDKITVTLNDLTTKYEVYLDPLYVVEDVSTIKLLEPKDSSYMTRCETIINQAKSKVNTDSNAGSVICIIVLSIALITTISYTSLKIYKNKKNNG